MIVTVYIAPNGREFNVLPARWENTSPVSESWALSHGWTKEERVIPDPPVVHQYSKLRLFNLLFNAGLWDEVKAAIEGAGLWEQWEYANDLSTDYPPFAQLLAQLRQTFGDELTDNILSQAEI